VTAAAARETFAWIPGGDAGTFATLERMAQLVRGEYASDAVRSLAIDVTPHHAPLGFTFCPGQRLTTLRQWLAGRLHFTEDPRGVEALHTPKRLIEMLERTGELAVDCDDVAIFAAALAASLGYPVRFVAVALDFSDAFVHVWAEAALPSRPGYVIEFDITRPFQAMPVGSFRRTLLYPVVL